MKALRSILNPKILIPVVFAVVLLGFVLSLGDLKKVAGDIVNFPRGDAALFFLLMVAYEIVRGIQWLYFLRGMKVDVGLRRAAFAFTGGEATKSLPAGNYFQNYLLEREKGVAVAYTAAGTTITILLEVTVCVVYLAIVGIRGWLWLRPVLIFGSLGVAVAVFIIAQLDVETHAPAWLGRRKSFKWVTEQGKTFLKGAETFVTPKRLLVGFLFAALYLFTAGTNYYIVVRALSITKLSYFDAVSAYLFGLGVGLILPAPTDIGVQEVSGVGVLRALGLGTTTAVSVTILYRILSLVSSSLIAVVTFILLHQEFGEAFSSRQGSGKVPKDVEMRG